MEPTAFVGSLPAIVGLAVRVLQLFGEQSRYLDKKRQLELFKLKCEIEALRRKHGLEIPQVLAADDVEILRVSGLPWFDPERVQETLWFRLARSWKPAYFLLVAGGLIILTLSCLAGAVATLYTIVEAQSLSSSELGTLSLIFLIDLLLGPMFVTSSIRMFVAFKGRGVQRTG